jgi:hypothetical protein
MRNRLVLTGLLCLMIAPLQATDSPGVEQGRVRVSPRAEVTGEVDGVRVYMEYGRPSKRGREIWGALVPWTRWWMPGADESTSLVTSGPLEFGTLLVPAGAYTIYTMPGVEVFMLVINKQTGQFHTVYQPEQDLGRVAMEQAARPDVVEQLMFSITPEPAGGGRLTLSWDDRAYSVRLRVPAGTTPASQAPSVD